MNRLIFSEGGQPVFLEDLKMLQDNMVELILSLFPTTDGIERGTDCDDNHLINLRNLPIYATSRHINGSADTNSETAQAHKLITRDGIYDVPETTISEVDTDTGNSNIMDCYYVLNEEIVEKREFEDGVTRTVVKNYTAQIVGHKPETGTYYPVKGVPSLDLLFDMLPVRGKNYYKSELG